MAIGWDKSKGRGFHPRSAWFCLTSILTLLSWRRKFSCPPVDYQRVLTIFTQHALESSGRFTRNPNSPDLWSHVNNVSSPACFIFILTLIHKSWFFFFFSKKISFVHRVKERESETVLLAIASKLLCFFQLLWSLYLVKQASKSLKISIVRDEIFLRRLCQTHILIRIIVHFYTHLIYEFYYKKIIIIILTDFYLLYLYAEIIFFC